MYFCVISLFAPMFAAVTEHGITGRAFARGQAKIEFINPREFTTDNYHRIDDKTYGGGPGMVMMAEPLAMAIQTAKRRAAQYGCQCSPVVYMSPQGQTLNETVVSTYSADYDGLIVLCGRYEGIDERLIETYVDIECSIGDYVLSGGELAAMVLIDTLVRKIPNVMGDNQSVVQDSFVEGLLDCPHYTKPAQLSDEYVSSEVPTVLLSGHHNNIARWRFLQQYQRTKQRRPDLLETFRPTAQQQKWLDQQQD